jgi:hypothetical protein
MDTSHGSPYDRGRADAYYRRQPEPHKWVTEMQEILTNREEIDEYMYGYDNETDRKDYGDF